jgi:hypothetical protein
MGIFNRTLSRLRWGLVPAALCAGLIRPQEIATSAMHITTQERLETETWWPTMSTAPLKEYAGSQSCRGCHVEQSSSSPTSMQLAATKGDEARSLPHLASSSFASGAVRYSLIAGESPLRLSVATGGRNAAQAIDWVVGAGDLGRTFLYEDRGKWFQSEVSFYSRPSMLGITTGFGPSTRTTAAEDLGNALSPAEARACFGCHTVHAATSEGLQPLHAEPGVGCEACHGPGQQHANNMAASKANGDSAIFQPANLSPADSIDFCGACHRSSADASLSVGPEADKATIRFQPARLERSSCWRATQDARLTCVACHDPHKPLDHNAVSYDTNCLQCHSGVKRSVTKQPIAKECPKATHDCVTCHMPKVRLPSMHGDFTDHDIQIVKDEPHHPVD